MICCKLTFSKRTFISQTGEVWFFFFRSHFGSSWQNISCSTIILSIFHISLCKHQERYSSLLLLPKIFYVFLPPGVWMTSKSINLIFCICCCSRNHWREQKKTSINSREQKLDSFSIFRWLHVQTCYWDIRHKILARIQI